MEMLWFLVIVVGLSAGCRLAAAIVTPDLSSWSRYVGPPPWIERRTQIGSCLNSAGGLIVATAISLLSAVTCQLAADI
jgi:hypothetical protein